MSNTPLYTLDSVSFGYGQESVLHNLSINLFPGRFYGIIGPNGSGKTTMLDLLGGVRHQRSGTIALYDQFIQSYPKRELAKLISLVPQEFDTGFGFTVEEAVMMGRHPHIDRFSAPSPLDYKKVDEALAAIGIEELRNQYTTNLSGGQKQRTIVARALAQDCPIVLLDEATSSLDIKYTLQIFDYMQSQVRQEGRTVIAVIHDLNLASGYCDEIIFLHEGSIFSHGTTEQQMTPTLIKQVFDVDADIVPDERNGSKSVRFFYGNHSPSN